MEMNATTVINRPTHTVFAYISDVANDVNWRTGVTESGLRSEPPLGPGSIGYAKAGDAETEYQIVSYESGKRVDWELVSGPFKGRGGYRLESVERGTQFTLVADIEPSGVMKLLGPVFGWMGRRRNLGDVEKLRDILESTPVHDD